MSLRVWLLAGIALIAGSITGDPTGDESTGTVEQGICQEFMCGTNSPLIASFGFWDLNLPTSLTTQGLPNVRGLQVLGFLQNGVSYLPRVYAGKLTATSGSTTLAGAQLTNGEFWLKNGSQVFKIRVSAVGSVDMWAQPPLAGKARYQLETYQLDWSEWINGAFGDYRNVCPHPPNREDPDTLGMVGPLAFQTVLFEGDRIDAIGKRDTGVDNTWFNIGCAGSALAKMALTGHTEAAKNARMFDTTLAERQTILKMFSADYCGTGDAFTVEGQPLTWIDDHNTMSFLYPQDHLALEARWNEHGAICLNAPRVDVHPTTLSSQTFPSPLSMYQQVQARCAIPTCLDGTFSLDGYHLLSATPF